MRRRDIDVRQALSQAREAVREHLKRSMNPVVPPGERVAEIQTPGQVVVLVGGYSVAEQAYYVLIVEWLEATTKRPGRWKCSMSRVAPDQVVFVGDEVPLARSRARKARLQRIPEHANDWRMEPLASIDYACVDESHASRTIGGALQLAKTYRHGSARAYAIADPMRTEDVTYRGAAINLRARREMEGAGLVVTLEAWNLRTGYFERATTAASSQD
jgi:hypothetical protein